MNRYKAMQGKTAGEGQAAEAVKQLQENDLLSWEDYYWGIKFILSNSEEAVDPAFVTGTINRAFRQGLTFAGYPEEYKDGLRLLSAYYGQYGKFKLVANQLNAYLAMDEHAPAWVYHDLLAAEIHIPSSLARILVNPKSFLTDLAIDDGTNEHLIQKQYNILKELLACGAKSMSVNKLQRANPELFEEAVHTYHLDDSLEWANFLNAAEGKDLIDIPQEQEPPIHPAEHETESIPENPPEDDKTRKIAELERLLREAQDQNKIFTERIAELEKYLDDSRKTVELLNQQIESNKRIIHKLQTEAAGNSHSTAEFEKAIAELNNNNDQLQKELAAKNDAISSISSELQKAIAEQKSLKERNDDLQDELYSITVDQAIEKIYGFLNLVVPDYTLLWLSHILPQLEKNWWQNCVIPNLGAETVKDLDDKGSSDLKDLDLAAMLKVMRGNYERFASRIGFTYTEKKLINDMLNVRNHWAHLSRNTITKHDALSSLKITRNFLRLLNADNETLLDVDTLTDDVNAFENFE